MMASSSAAKAGFSSIGPHVMMPRRPPGASTRRMSSSTATGSLKRCRACWHATTSKVSVVEGESRAFPVPPFDDARDVDASGRLDGGGRGVDAHDLPRRSHDVRGHAGEDPGPAGHVEHAGATHHDERVERPLGEASAEDGIEVLRIDRRRHLVVDVGAMAQQRQRRRRRLATTSARRRVPPGPPAWVAAGHHGARRYRARHGKWWTVMANRRRVTGADGASVMRHWRWSTGRMAI